MTIYDGGKSEQGCPKFLTSRKEARVVRLGDQALWMAKPRAPGAKPGAESAAPTVAIERGDWDFVRARCPGLTAFEALPRAKRRDVLTAWLAEAPAPVKTEDAVTLLALAREKLVAAEGMELADAVAAVEELIAWANDAPDAPVGGRVVGPQASDVRTLYFDTRPTADWPALARRRDKSPGACRDEAWAFGFPGGLALAPEALSEEERGAASVRRSGAEQLIFSFF